MKRRIAIFEDEPADQELFRRILASDCEVLIFESPAPASEYSRLKEFSPELLVVDCHMAGDHFAGVEVVKHVRGQFPEVPIIICSKFLNRNIGGKSLYTIYRDLPGVSDVISKTPFPTAGEILQRIS